MKKILFLALISSFPPTIAVADAGKRYFWSDWAPLSSLEKRFEKPPQSANGKKHGHWSEDREYYTQMKGFQPYLEDSRHEQVPQWEHQDWYLEDWFTQEKGMDMVKGFYEADIFRDQFQHQNRKKEPIAPKTLVVGPAFYRLSGFDKRRVVKVLDVTYGVTQKNKEAVFVLEDWHTHRPIGYYTKDGLRLN